MFYFPFLSCFYLNYSSIDNIVLKEIIYQFDRYDICTVYRVYTNKLFLLVTVQYYTFFMKFMRNYDSTTIQIACLEYGIQYSLDVLLCWLNMTDPIYLSRHMTCMVTVITVL